MNKWEKVLEPIDKNKKFWIKCVIAAGLVLVIAVIVDTWNVQGEEIKYVNLTYICDIIIALSTAVLGTFLLNIIYNLSESHKISAISKVSYENLLPDLLNSLEKFNGRYRKDESITVELHKYDSNSNKNKDFYKIILEYQYTTIISNLKELEFKFCRIYNGSVKEFTGGLNDDYMKCDFIWGVDEREFEAGVIGDDDYWVSQLIIGDNQIYNIDQYRKVITPSDTSTTNRIIVYSIPVVSLKNIDIAKPIQLSYCISLPLEKEDILLLTHELPTEKAKVIFDYTEVKDEIVVYGMPVTGTISPFELEEGADTKIKYVISGWILPKQGYIFGWWKKQNNGTI